MELVRYVDRLADLSDFNATGLSDGAVPRYDAATGKYGVTGPLRVYGSNVSVTGSTTLSGGTVMTAGFIATGTPVTSGYFDFRFHKQQFYAEPGTAPRSGMRGWWLNKIDRHEPTPHGFTFSVSGRACWDFGMDYDTVRGYSDMVLCFDHTAPNTVVPGTSGADIIRVSPAADGGFTKVNIAYNSGSPSGNPAFLSVAPAPGLTCLQLYASGGSSVNAISLTQQATGHSAVRWNWNNKWIWGVDINAANDRHWYWYDNTGHANALRMFLQADDNFTPKLVLGGSNGQAAFTAFGATSATSGDWPQHYFFGGYSLLQNRGISISQIVGGGGVRNFVMLNGYLSGGTGTSGLIYSQFASALGIMADDNNISLVAAAAGAAATPLKGVTVNYSGSLKLGFYDTAAVARQTVTGSRGANAALADLLTKLANLGLITDGTSA